MDGYSRGFRDGAAEACQATGERLDDAIGVLQELPEQTVFSREKVIEIMQLMARDNKKLSAQIMAVGSTRQGDSDGDEGEASP